MKINIQPNRSRKLFAVFVVLALFFFFNVALLNLASANPIPELSTNITISNPQNKTYNTDKVLLSFSVESMSLVSTVDFAYDLDGQELEPIENITIVKETYIPINPDGYSRKLVGNCTLSNLAEGSHSITIYQIDANNQSHPSSMYGDLGISETVVFTVELADSSLPDVISTAYATAVTGISVVVVAVGFSVYIRKRRQLA